MLIARSLCASSSRRLFPILCRNFTSDASKPLRRFSRFSAYSALAAAVGALSGLALLREEVEAKSANAPVSSKKQNFTYVIIGAGIGAISAANELQKISSDKILMVGNAPRSTYEVSSQEFSLNKNPNLDFRSGVEVHKLDIVKKELVLTDGTLVSFDKCLIATGGKAPRLPNITKEASPRVLTVHTTRDFESLKSSLSDANCKHITVVGGGFLGTEVALRIAGEKTNSTVTQVYAEPGALHKYLPEYYRAYTTALLRSKGIEQKSFSMVNGVQVDPSDNKLVVSLESWEESLLKTDLVVFAPTRIPANVDIAEDAGLEIDTKNGGVVVNAGMLSFADIFACGDVVSYPNVALGRRRDQNYDHAKSSGIVAAQNMCGSRKIYDNVSVTKSSLGILGLTNVYVGNVDSSLETVGFWELSKKKRDSGADFDKFASRYNKGVVFYLDKGTVVGINLINIEDPEDTVRAKVIIMNRTDYSNLQLDEIENELRDQVGFELQMPVTRNTYSKTTGKDELVRRSGNVYKQFRVPDSNK